MGRISLHQDWHGYQIPLGTFDLSEEGERVLRGSAPDLYTIEDATERFMEEIDYWQGKLSETEKSQIELMAVAMRDPLAMNYDEMFMKLKWSWEMQHQVKAALEKDLSVLLGSEMPFCEDSSWSVAEDGEIIDYG